MEKLKIKENNFKWRQQRHLQYPNISISYPKDTIRKKTAKLVKNYSLRTWTIEIQFLYIYIPMYNILLCLLIMKFQ